MPFDHASCPNCQAKLNPEHLVRGTQGPVCPKCGAQLGMQDLFGTPFDDDDSGNNLSLDDLVSGGAPAGRKPQDKDLTLENLLTMDPKRKS